MFELTSHALATGGSACTSEFVAPVARRERPLDLEALLEHIPLQRRQLKPRQYLFRAGQPRTALFLIHAGFFKASVNSVDGREKLSLIHI